MERRGGRSAAEVKTPQHGFAHRTDAALAELKRRLAAGEGSARGRNPADAPAIKPDRPISRTDAEHVAIRYFQAIDEANLNRGDYVTTERGE